MKKARKGLLQLGPFILGLSCALLAQVLSYFPYFTETVYRNGVFAVFRWLRDSLFTWIPVPMMLIIILVSFFFLLRGWFKKRLFIQRPWWRTLLNTLGIVLAWFYVSWGWNYSAPGVMKKLDATVKPLSTEEFEYLQTWSLENAMYHRSKSDTARFHTSEVTKSDVSSIHSAVREYLNSIDVITPGNVAMRRISSTGWMRKMGVAGIYMPFSGEGHADASYLTLRQWFILAHEFAHGYGITDEGECNYIAFEALTQSGVHRFQYAAWLELADHVLPHVADTSSTMTIPEVIERDRRALFEDAMNYRNGMQSIAMASNNLYLLSQGVEEGISSYDLLPEMIVATHTDRQGESGSIQEK